MKGELSGETRRGMEVGGELLQEVGSWGRRKDYVPQ